MKLKSEFYGDVSNYVMNERKALADLHEQLKAVEHDIFSNDKRFTPKYIREELYPKRNAIKKQIEARKAKAHDSIQQMCDSYIAELRDEDELDPTKLTDDVRLLNSGVKMTSRDIKAMLKRNSDNRTMLQVILRYADEHNIETGGTYYAGNTATINHVATIPVVADTCIRNFSSNIMGELMGEGSGMGQFFSED